MKHARTDYQDRIVDLEEKIPADEPVFLLRGQDRAAPVALDYYAQELERGFASPELVASVRRHRQRMLDWQEHVACKVPDVPDGALDFPDPVVDAETGKEV